MLKAFSPCWHFVLCGLRHIVSGWLNGRRTTILGAYSADYLIRKKQSSVWSNCTLRENAYITIPIVRLMFTIEFWRNGNPGSRTLYRSIILLRNYTHCIPIRSTMEENTSSRRASLRSGANQQKNRG